MLFIFCQISLSGAIHFGEIMVKPLLIFELFNSVGEQ
jgi:hypothetical protein